MEKNLQIIDPRWLVEGAKLPSEIYGLIVVQTRIDNLEKKQDGAIKESIKEIKTGKNIGRSNESNAVYQALLEATSMWNKKVKRELYTETKPAAGPKTEAEIIKPMLLQPYDVNKAVFPAYIQRKYNGVRCLGATGNATPGIPEGIKFYSRTLKLFGGLTHLGAQIGAILKNVNFGVGGVFLDGELFHPEWPLSKINGVVSANKKEWDEEEKKQIAKIGWWIYDIYIPSSPTMIFKDRLDQLGKLFPYVGGNIHLADTISVSSEKDMMKYFKKWVKEEKMEGLVYRNPNGIYEPDKRSYGVMKVKDFDEEDFEIIGFQTGRGKARDQIQFVCRVSAKQHPDKVIAEFEVGSYEISTEKRQAMLKIGPSFIGKKLTVRFYGWTSSKKGEPAKPSHAVGITVRDYD